MPCQLICPNLRCRKILKVPDEARGKVVRCQYCQTMLRVPLPRQPNGVPDAAEVKPGAGNDPYQHMS